MTGNPPGDPLMPRKSEPRRLSLAAILFGVIAGCCPEPAAKDSGSAAQGDGAGSRVEARFSQIQGAIFEKRCVTDCHESVSAAASLRLTRALSYASLVNQRSQQITTQLRVVPGNPGASYLVKKMMGGSGIVGDQMPRLAPPRPQSEIESIRSWIASGALND